MTELNYQRYYTRRAEASHRLAAKAADTGIAAIHEELARRYEEIARQTIPIEPRR